MSGSHIFQTYFLLKLNLISKKEILMKKTGKYGKEQKKIEL